MRITLAITINNYVVKVDSDVVRLDVRWMTTTARKTDHRLANFRGSFIGRASWRIVYKLRPHSNGIHGRHYVLCLQQLPVQC